MKNIMKKTLLVSFIILFCLSCALTVLSLRTKNVNAEIIVQNENIADYYVLNDSKVFPEKISVDYAGKSYEASNGIVEFPGGIAEKIGNTPIDLKTIGKCYAKYYFKSDAGELVTAVDDFVVSDKKFNFTMNNGSSVTIAEETTEICENNLSNVLYTGKKGMILRLNEGSSFKYNVPIDLSKSNADGLCEIMTVDPRLNRVSYIGDEITDEDGYVVDESGNFKLDAFNRKYKNNIFITGIKNDVSFSFCIRTTITCINLVDRELIKFMPKQIIEYQVKRSFNSNNISLLESLIEYIEDLEVIEDDDEPPISDCRDIL